MIELYITLIALALFIIILVRRGYINLSLKHLQTRFEKERRRKRRIKNSREISKRKLETESERRQNAVKNTRKNLAHINSFLKKTELCIARGELDEAIKLLISVLAIDEGHHKANETLAELYMAQKQYGKAEILYKKLIETYPNNPVYHTNAGHCHYNQKRFKNALIAYENAIRLDQHKSIRYANVARAFLALESMENAIKNLERAHKLDKRNTSYLFLLANSHLSHQDPIKAREYTHMILDIEPYNNNAKELLKDILELL